MIFRLERAYSGSKGNESRLKLDIFNPKMLHKCPHALGGNSNPIDGHRWAAMGPLMGLNGVSVRVSIRAVMALYQAEINYTPSFFYFLLAAVSN